MPAPTRAWDTYPPFWVFSTVANRFGESDRLPGVLLPGVRRDEFELSANTNSFLDRPFSRHLDRPAVVKRIFNTRSGFAMSALLGIL